MHLGRRWPALIAVPAVLLVLCSFTFADTRLRLRVGEFDPTLETPDLPERLRLSEEPAAGYFVVQFSRAIDRSLLDAVRASGVTPLHYLPDRSYVVRVPAGRKADLAAMPEIRWLGPIQPGWKISPDLGRRPLRDPARRADGKLYATIDLHDGESLERVRPLLEALDIEVIQADRFSDTRRFKVRAGRSRLEQAARLPAVSWIDELGEITYRNNNAHWVVQSDVSGAKTIWDHGLHGENQIIGHIDSLLDMSSCYFRDPSDNTPGPGHRKVIAYRSSIGLGAASHGTHTAGTAAGNSVPINGSLGNAGHAYAAKLSFSYSSDVDGLGFSSSNLYGYFVSAHEDGARLHSNSWGDDGLTGYSSWARDIDRFSYDYEESLVLFAATNTSTLRTPENAKNVLAVGASLNGTLNDSFCSGGTGPTADGRRKPEIFAPGCSIFSARAVVSCSTASSTGTSMACPAVTGGGALLRQYLTEGWYPSGSPNAADAITPSGALLKAMLLNSTVDMTDIAGYPSQQEGWGRVLLDNVLHFAGDVRTTQILADVRNDNGLGTGEIDNFSVDVTASQEALRVTLVFTEPAAALGAITPTVNDLDLVVTSPGGIAYRGNMFSGGVSAPGGTADPINNVEMVMLETPDPGSWLVTVEGTAVNQGSQGYALVVTGQVAPGSGGSVRYATHSVDDGGPLANGDGAADPGETIYVPVSLLNLRTESTLDLSGKLATTRGDLIKVTGDSASYADIPANSVGASDAPHYEMTLSPDTPCGSAIPIDIRASHAAGQSDSGFTLQVGRTELDQSASDTPLTLPLFASSPVTSTIAVADDVNIENINASVRIAHNKIGELKVSLTSPQGTTVVLHDHSGGATSGIDTIYDALADPEGPGTMNDFDGESTAGNWTLSVTDDVVGIPVTPAGSIEAWSLDVHTAAGVLCLPLECPGDPVPGAVGPTLTVEIGGSDVRFTWSAVAGAAAYRLWRSAASDFAVEELVGVSPTTSFDEIGGGANPGNWYYRVRAINSCRWEGP